MKALIITAFIIGITVVSNAQSTPAATVATNIAQKMKDTLGLSDTQKDQLYQINLQLHEAKMARRQQYAGTDSVRIHVQRVENTRDSLYRAVLNEEKYQLYLQKKRNLVSNQ